MEFSSVYLPLQMAGRSRRQRIDSFKGSLTKYSEYLEQLVCNLRTQVQYLSRQVGHQNAVPVPHQPSTQQLIQSQPSTQQLSGSFVFQLETPELQARNSSRPSIEPWKAETKRFLDRVPKDEAGWIARREEVQLHESEAVIHTFCLLTLHSPQVRSLKIGNAPHDNASILHVLGEYGGLANGLRAHSNFAKRIAHYSALLFVCLSIIALREGSRIKAVDDQLRKYLKDKQGECTAGGTYLSQLRTGALWAVKRMDELDKKGLGHRGPEIFVLCMFLSNMMESNS